MIGPINPPTPNAPWVSSIQNYIYEAGLIIITHMETII